MAIALDIGLWIASAAPADLTLRATRGRLPRTIPCAGGLAPFWHRIVKSHRPLAPRAALLGSKAAADRWRAILFLDRIDKMNQI